MGGYIGATAVGLTTTAADVQGDITSTDTTPELILKNTTETDADGSRDGKITFKGEQSGGEESTLAQIQSSHDGTADDQKGDLIFKTNDGSDGASPTERLRIDSAGVTSVSGSLTLDNSGQSQSLVSVGGGSTNAALTLRGSTGSAYAWQISSNAHVASALEFTRSSAVGNTTFSSPKLILDNDGLKFNGDTAAANALNDYEEGTFNVTLTTAGGSVTLNSVYNTMSYTKIGRQVTIFGLIITSAVSSPTGAYAHIDTLPFTSVNLTEGSGRSGGGVFWWDGSNAHVKPWEISEGATRLSIYIDATTITAGDDFYFSCTYQTA